MSASQGASSFRVTEPSFTTPNSEVVSITVLVAFPVIFISSSISNESNPSERMEAFLLLFKLETGCVLYLFLLAAPIPMSASQGVSSFRVTETSFTTPSLEIVFIITSLAPPVITLLVSSSGFFTFCWLHDSLLATFISSLVESPFSFT